MSSQLIQQGRDALAQGAWEEACSWFKQALRAQETPEAFEELGVAAWWLNDESTTINSRERAFSLYKEAGNLRGAARVAIWVANDYLEFRGEQAVANGWLQRARRLLEGLTNCQELGLLHAFSAHISLMSEKDPATARRLAAACRRIAQEIGEPDLEMIGMALEGLAFVSEGQVTEGMRLLDEATATAVAGESKDLNLIGTTCCYLIHACERVRDYDRAAQWCDRVKEFCRRWRFGSLFAICRTQYASLLMWRGDWTEAETELASAANELSSYRPGLVAACTVRLAELRRRQGRWDEAAALFGKVENHILSLLGRGLLAFDREDPITAVEFAQRFLRRVLPGDKAERVPGLELLTCACVSSDRIGEAKAALAELRSTVDLVPTPPMRAAAWFAEGVVKMAEGELDAARRKFEDTVDLYRRIPMPFEAGRARRRLAHVFGLLNRTKRSQEELHTALKEFHALGAAWEAQQTEAALSSLTPSNTTTVAISTGMSGVLTRRESEILGLIALGKSNDTIAAELFLSIRTVERHVSNIYQKIGTTGKAARAAATAWALKHVEARH